MARRRHTVRKRDLDVQKRLREARKSLEEMRKEIEPYIKRREFQRHSTAGEWRETSSLYT